MLVLQVPREEILPPERDGAMRADKRSGAVMAALVPLEFILAPET
jgi:hypothetical protein